MLRGERDKYVNGLIVIMYIFQLTRSVGSVTLKGGSKYSREEISTHTLRGERDLFPNSGYTLPEKFQLTRSVGSVTTNY